VNDATGSPRKALITGIGGQDGYYLAARLCEIGYAVVGTSHRSDAASTLRAGDSVVDVRYVDLGSDQAVDAIVRDERPDEIYHVCVDDKFKRPPDRVHAVGNPARARADLDWRPSFDFQQMIVQMVEAEAI
jgi:GDPmannose 4,6-dehydratase